MLVTQRYVELYHFDIVDSFSQICCFDKTGTLTENKMQLAGLAVKDPKLSQDYKTNTKSALVMSCCHALFEDNDVVYGDAMEQAMIEALDSIELLEQQVVYNNEVLEKKIIVPFSSEEKHMTVVATSADKGWSTALVKGQPGKVKQYLKKVPSNYDGLNNELSSAGLRVWALCYKDLIDDDLSREGIETGMTFAGFLCFRNQLKPDTNRTLNSLRESGHEIKVITGDQQLTALHVAKEINLMAWPRCDQLRQRSYRYQWPIVFQAFRQEQSAHQLQPYARRPW